MWLGQSEEAGMRSERTGSITRGLVNNFRDCDFRLERTEKRHLGGSELRSHVV